MDIVGNDDEKFDYEKINLKAKYNGSTEKMQSLIKKRAVDGKPEDKIGLTYAEWSKKGRLNVKSMSEGPYLVIAEKPGLKKLELQVNKVAGDLLRLNVKLEKI